MVWLHIYSKTNGNIWVSGCDSVPTRTCRNGRDHTSTRRHTVTWQSGIEFNMAWHVCNIGSLLATAAKIALLSFNNMNENILLGPTSFASPWIVQKLAPLMQLSCLLRLAGVKGLKITKYAKTMVCSFYSEWVYICTYIQIYVYLQLLNIQLGGFAVFNVGEYNFQRNHFEKIFLVRHHV